MQLNQILLDFGLNNKECAAYICLLERGPSPVRVVARNTGINRGTAYDILKKLVDLGLASIYHKGKQHFVAEPPERLIDAVEDKQTQLQRLKVQISEKLPEIKTQFTQAGGRPNIRVYEGTKGVRTILEDVLHTLSNTEDKEYYVYSSATEEYRQIIYKDFASYNKKRIALKINVKTISLGLGGSLSGLDDRKQLTLNNADTNATHELIYGGKIAHIGLDASQIPFGVIIESSNIYQSQKLVFENLWSKLK